MSSSDAGLSPRESGAFIAAHAKDVTISAEGVKNTVQHVRTMFQNLHHLQTAYFSLMMVNVYKSSKSCCLGTQIS